MQHLIRGVAVAATLFLAPAPAAAPASVLARPAQPVAAVARVDAPRPSGLAPEQEAADFAAWLGAAPAHRAQAGAFRARLAAAGVADVVPFWQLLRTASDWRACGAARFEVAPADKWEHIVETLRFVRDEVVPAVGPVEALSGYRNEALNACAHGVPQSAHRLFFALDLAPVNPAVTRAAMIRGVCAAHATGGHAHDAGLGFYSGRRFHVDSNGYRRWGADGRGATSPCAGVAA
jgi:hypothetical protein